MLARSTHLQHPSGATFRTPLLLPSFSSKGFGFTKSGTSEVGQLFRLASEYLTESVLLSAYDLHYKHVRQPRSILTAITYVDSGGYETTDFQDLSATFRQPMGQKPWDEARLKTVYDAWPDHIPAVFVNHDRRATIKQQIKSAQRLFSRYPKQLHTILLKPQTKRERTLPIAEIIDNATALGHFDIIGLTEKELGRSNAERMQNIARIRVALDRAELKDRPLHIFGSLDPISVPLYFVAGAEIFDGLTWLRYGYNAGAALYHQNCAARTYGIHHSDDQVKLLSMQTNLVELSQLTLALRRFLNAGDFGTLHMNADVVRNAYDVLRNEVPGVE